MNDYVCKVYEALDKENGGVLSFARLQHLAMDIQKWCNERQKPAEWSEEDEKTIEEAIVHLEKYATECVQGGNSKNYIFGLASRLDHLRPQPRWKPSEEEMDALCGVVEMTIGEDNHKPLALLEWNLRKYLCK